MEDGSEQAAAIARRKLQEADRIKLEKQRTEDNRRRRESLNRKYGTTIATKIINGQIWIGMTKGMLGESLGVPYDVNRSVYTNLIKEQWVYGSGIYVYVENGIVTSWQD